METPRPRRKRSFRLAVAVLVVAAGAAVPAIGAPHSADGADDVLAYFNTGTSLPVHPAEFDEFWQVGWSVGLGLGVPVTKEWEITAQFQYQRHAADESAQASDLLLSGPGGVVLPVAAIDGRDLTVLTLMTEARFLVPSTRRSPTWFLAFGFGAGEVFTSDAIVTSVDPGLAPLTIVGDSDAAFSSSMGGGFELDLSPGLRLTVDSIYTLVFTEGTSTQFLPLRVGLAFRIR